MLDGSHERDQTIDRFLRRTAVTPPHGGVTGACLDAETLAAWMSGGLSGAALESVQLHVADCPRCQEVAGTLARLGAAVPQPEPAAEPRRRSLAWLVPLAAAAAAVAIWFAVPGNLGRPLEKAERERAAETPAPSAQTAPFDRRRPDGTAERRSALTPSAEVAPPAPAERRAVREAPAAAPPAAPRGERGTLAVDDAAAPLAQSAPGAATPFGAKEAAADAVKPRIEASRAPAAPAPFAARAVSAADIVSPDPAVRWRILGASVQHSSNGGATWEAASTGSPAELTAGAAPAPAVCWLVGRNGVVLLTVDGRTWRRVPFPEGADLSAVRAVDAGGRVATVLTSDGRTYVTTDAGTTWTAR